MTGNNELKKEKGFTLVELIVSIAIFSTVIGAITTIFVSTVRSQQRMMAYQQLLDNASYVLEYMSRTLRMAQKDETGGCIAIGDNYAVTSNSVEFKNYSDKCQKFFLDTDSDRLAETRESQTYFLTPNNIEITAFNIDSVGLDPNDTEQPRITIYLEMQLRGSSETVKLQTTVSQRNLDV